MPFTEDQMLEPTTPGAGPRPAGAGAADAVAAAAIPLERDVFLRSLLRELSGALEDVVGIEEASGFISIVGAAIGEQIDATYRKAIAVDRLSREQVGAVLVDLKRRIQGDFYVIDEDADRLVLGNTACPFGAFVKDRPSLCMMTSNVFGSIAANNTGYAHVAIEKAIARGDPGCRVVVTFRPGATPPDEGREYFGTDA
jgi:predicted ArsR family transcriptional regulator